MKINLKLTEKPYHNRDFTNGYKEFFIARAYEIDSGETCHVSWEITNPSFQNPTEADFLECCDADDFKIIPALHNKINPEDTFEISWEKNNKKTAQDFGYKNDDFLMNIYTGDVDSAKNWAEESFDWENPDDFYKLVQVRKNYGEDGFEWLKI